MGHLINMHHSLTSEFKEGLVLGSTKIRKLHSTTVTKHYVKHAVQRTKMTGKFIRHFVTIVTIC